MNFTACPLDCYDTCKIEYKDGKLKGAKDHYITAGYLCHHLDKYKSFARIKSARYKDKEISLDEALLILKEQILQSKEKLYYQGSGNLALMQALPRLFFTKAGFDIAGGSLCDGAGDAGIENSRGANLSLPYSQINKSDVVIIWGRDPYVSNKHVIPFLKNKKIIVIDPIKTQTAAHADIHLALKPRSDIYLALMFSRLALLSGIEDKEFLENRCENFEEFKEFISSYPLVGLEKLTQVSLVEATKIIEMLSGKKVSILLGIGAQKYVEGADIFRVIDGFAALLGLFGKEGCGVSYLSNSTYGFAKPFSANSSKYSKATVDFGKFDTVFISNANPLSQMPNTTKVKAEFKKAKFKVYFGLWENETSKYSDLVIPAANFLEKEDIKACYSHEFVYKMPKLEENEDVLSEYDFTKKMFDLMEFEGLKSEKEYLDELVSCGVVQRDNELISKVYEDIPYKDGFYTKSKKFIFIDEFDSESEDSEEFYLLSSRQLKSLNSQFVVDDTLYVPKVLGYSDGDSITLYNKQAEGEFVVKNLEGLRDDCLIINSGAKNANLFTKSKLSYEGRNAVFQDFKVNIKR